MQPIVSPVEIFHSETVPHENGPFLPLATDGSAFQPDWEDHQREKDIVANPFHATRRPGPQEGKEHGVIVIKWFELKHSNTFQDNQGHLTNQLRDQSI